MRTFAVKTKIFGGAWPTFGGTVPPGPNVEPPLAIPTLNDAFPQSELGVTELSVAIYSVSRSGQICELICT